MKYDCYKCLWTTHIKTKMTSHLGRIRPCKTNRIILLTDIIKQYILEGLSYQEYEKKMEQMNIAHGSHNIAPGSHNIAPKSNNIAPESHNIAPKIHNKLIKCIYCDKNFCRTSSLHRHLKICKEKKTDDEVKDSMNQIVTLLNDQLIDCKKEITKRDNEMMKRDIELKEELKKQNNYFKKELTKRDNEFKKELIKRE